MALSRTPPCGPMYKQQMSNLWTQHESCKAVHQSLPGTRLTGLWCNNSLSFNFFCFLFLFVCLFPWFWLLSFLRRYVHLLFPNASPALGCFWWSAMLFVLFLIFFWNTFAHIIFVDFYFGFAPLRWLIWTSGVCLFSVSLSWWFAHSLSSLWVVAGRSPGSFAALCARLGELMLCDRSAERFDPLPSLRCGGHSLWSFFGSCIIPSSSHTANTTPDGCLTIQIDHEPIHPIGELLFVLWLCGTGILHLFNKVALLPLSSAVHGSEGWRCGARPDWTELWERSVGRGGCRYRI